MGFGSINVCDALKYIFFSGDVENIENSAFIVEDVTIYGKKDSILHKYVEGIDGLTFEIID